MQLAILPDINAILWPPAVHAGAPGAYGTHGGSVFVHAGTEPHVDAAVHDDAAVGCGVVLIIPLSLATSETTCAKYASRSGLSHGLLTAACAQCLPHDGLFVVGERRKPQGCF